MFISIKMDLALNKLQRLITKQPNQDYDNLSIH